MVCLIVDDTGAISRSITSLTKAGKVGARGGGADMV